MRKPLSKKILAFTLSIIMVLGTMPISVFAADTEEYNLWVGGVQFTAENLVIDSTDNADISGGKATYEPDTNILTLDGFTYTGTGDYYNSAIVFGTDSFNVQLVGTNKLENTSQLGYGLCGAAYADITISGNGSLCITGVGNYGIDTGGTVNISSNVSIINEEYGISADQVNISGGTVSITVNGECAGIETVYNTEISGGSVTIYSEFGNGIQSDRDVLISNAAIEIEAGYRGIYADYDVSINDCSKVTIKANDKMGIYSKDAVDIVNCCDVEILSVYDYGIYAQDDVTISNSCVKITSHDHGIITTSKDEAPIIIENNSVVTIETEEDAIRTEKEDSPVTINDSTVYITQSDYGIYTKSKDSSVTIENGSIVTISSRCYGVYARKSSISIADSAVSVQSDEDGAFDSEPDVTDYDVANIWYGDSKAEAFTAGVQDISSLEENYSQKYVKIALVYTVTFEAESEGGSYEKEFGHGDVITIPANKIFEDIFRRTGHTLTGWQGYTEGMTMPLNDVIFTAIYSPNEYTVSFDANGGENIDPIEVTFGEKYGSLPSSAITGLSGGASNWYLVDNDGNVTDTNIKKLTKVSVAEDHTLFVKRNVLTPDVSIALTVPGGISNDYHYYIPGASQRVLTATVNNSNTEILDYTYQWYKDGVAIDGATANVLTLDGNVSDSGTYKVEVTATLKDGTGITVTESTASQECEKKVTIHHATNIIYYDANGGTGGASNNSTGSTTATVSNNIPQREGYTFSGWNTEADGSGDDYSAGITYTFADDNGNGGCKVTLYAQWTIKTYTVTLVNGVGYTITVDKTEFEYMDSPTITLVIADGYSKTENFAVLLNGRDMQWGDQTEMRLQNCWENIEITVIGIADITAPEVEMSVKGVGWKQFINKVTFGLFFKENVEVKVEATDLGSKIKSAEYLITETAFTTEDAVRNDTSVWTALTLENGVARFRVTEKGKKYIYVRVADNDGNIAVVSSDGGVVEYTDATADTTAISFIKTTTEAITAKVNLNGNTIKAIFNGADLIDSSNYSVAADGTITFNTAYLDTLAEGIYSLNIVYNPQGESYAEYKNGTGANINDTPAQTSITLNVGKQTGTVSITSNISKTYDGSAVSAPTYDRNNANGDVVVEYKKLGADDNTYSADAPKNAGDYTVRVTVKADDAGFYTEAVSAPVDFTIGKAALTVTVEDNNIIVNTALPTFTYTVEGLVNGDSLLIEPNFESDADVTAVGEYYITANGADAGDNYTISYVPAKLSVLTDNAVDAAKGYEEELKDYDPETVTSEYKAELDEILDEINTLLDDEAITDNGKKVLEEVKEQVLELIKEITDAEAATDTENTEKVKDITYENVTPDNKTDLEKAKADLKEALDEHGNNMTEDEKKAVEEGIKRIDDALKVIFNVEAAQELIDKLPENITKNDEAAIKAADDALGALSDYEKSLVDEDAKKALDDAKAALAELNKPADTTSPNTGDNSNLFLWLALLFISGGLSITLTVYDRKRKAVKR